MFRVRIDCSHPFPRFPTRFPSGIRQSSNARSAVGLARSPSFVVVSTFVTLNPDPSNPQNVDLTNGEVYNADLTNADFTNADLTNADLTNADLTGANMQGALGLDSATKTGARGLRPPPDDRE